MTQSKDNARSKQGKVVKFSDLARRSFINSNPKTAREIFDAETARRAESIAPTDDTATGAVAWATEKLRACEDLGWPACDEVARLLASQQVFGSAISDQIASLAFYWHAEWIRAMSEHGKTSSEAQYAATAKAVTSFAQKVESIASKMGGIQDVKDAHHDHILKHSHWLLWARGERDGGEYDEPERPEYE